MGWVFSAGKYGGEMPRVTALTAPIHSCQIASPTPMSPLYPAINIMFPCWGYMCQDDRVSQMSWGVDTWGKAKGVPVFCKHYGRQDVAVIQVWPVSPFLFPLVSCECFVQHIIGPHSLAHVMANTSRLGEGVTGLLGQLDYGLAVLNKNCIPHNTLTTFLHHLL